MEAVTLTADERSELGRKARAATLNALRAVGGEGWREAIRELALANGEFTARELAAPPPDAVGGRFERLVDYELAWALTNLKRDGLVANPTRAVWKLAGDSVARPASAATVLTADDRPGPRRAVAVQRPAARPKRSRLRRLIYG